MKILINISKTLKVLFLVMAMSSILFLLENQVAYAITPTFNFNIFNLNDGGVQGSFFPSTPVIVSVTDPDEIGSGSIKVTVSSSIDPTGIDLTLNEVSPGTFSNTNLALMSGNNKVEVGGSAIIIVFDTFFTVPDPFVVQTLGGPPIIIVSNSDTTGIHPNFTETGLDTNLYTSEIKFGETTNDATNTLASSPGDIFTVVDLGGGNFNNGYILGNPDAGRGGIQAEVNGIVTATYQGDSNSFSIGPNPSPGRGSGGLVRPGLVVDNPSSSSGSCNNCQPPTLGIDRNFNKIVSGGFSYNDNPVDVEQFYTPYPLIKVDVGEKNIATLKIYDDGGIDSIAHVGLAFGLGHGESFSQSKATISLDRTFDGKEITDVFDPEHTLDNVKINTSTSSCSNSFSQQCLVVKIHHIFREELEFNMVSTNVWDNKRNSWQNFYNHGIEVSGDSLNPPKVKMVAFGEKDMRGLFKLTQIDKKEHLWSDKFGNLYENKGNDRFDRIYSVPTEIVYDKVTQHGCDRKCNWFNENKLNQKLVAELTLDELLDGKIIEGEPPQEAFAYEFKPITRAEDLDLQKSIIYEKQRAEKVLENLK